jgi:hypothetical protein
MSNLQKLTELTTNILQASEQINSVPLDDFHAGTEEVKELNIILTRLHDEYNALVEPTLNELRAQHDGGLINTFEFVRAVTAIHYSA